MGEGSRSGTVQDAIAKWHQHMNNIYDCNLEMFQSLGEMYVADARFAAFYEKIASGLSVFMRDAINVYVGDRGLDK